MGSDETAPASLRLPKKKWVIAAALTTIGVLIWIASCQNKAPDNPTAVIQTALKKQQFYSGEITGEYDEATREAVRQFQLRNGLEVTPTLNAVTLEAIAAGERQLTVPKPATVETAPARERARQFAEEDRQFLQELEEHVEDQPQIGKPAQPSEPEAPDRTARLNRKVARQFLDDYLQAAENGSAEQEVSFYADEVKYFTDRKIDKGTILKDQEAYRQRWPDRKFTLLGEPEITRSPKGDFTLLFRIRYEVQRGGERATGRTENIMRLRDLGNGPRIVVIRERKIEN